MTMPFDPAATSEGDCAGLDVFVRAHHRFLAAHGTRILTGGGPRIHRLLTITGLDDVLLCATATPGPAAPRVLPATPQTSRSLLDRPEGRPT